jgi:hypothetical protein
MKTPKTLKSNQDKLKFLYRTEELLRLEHNERGAEVGKSITLEEFMVLAEKRLGRQTKECPARNKQYQRSRRDY